MRAKIRPIAEVPGVIVDGYNILFRYLQGPTKHVPMEESEMEFGRMLLLQGLDKLALTVEVETVFDGNRHRKDALQRTAHHRIIFTPNSQIADDYICLAVARAKKRKVTTKVATDDSELRKRVRTAGGTWVSSAEFIKELQLQAIAPNPKVDLKVPVDLKAPVDRPIELT